MLYVRGQNYDYDYWATYGGSQWNSTNVINVYKSFENFTALTNYSDLHGFGNEFDITNHAVMSSDIMDVWINAVQGAIPGLPEVIDYNGIQQLGVTRSFEVAMSTLSGGQYHRESSSTAFLNSAYVNSDGTPVRGRGLTVYSEVFVTTLLYLEFPFSAPQVIGVEYIDVTGTTRQVYAREEVILSAGTYGSPVILLRSGIGPCPALTALGITCVVNSTYVGQNLQDQALIQLVVQAPNDTVINSEFTAFTNAANSAKFALGAWFTSPLASQYTDPTISSTPVNDVEFIWKITSLLDANLGELNQLNNFDPVTNTARFPQVFSMSAFQVRPKCRSSISLSNKHPFYEPLLNYNFFCDAPGNQSVDLQWHRAMLKLLLQIVQNMQAVNPGWQPLYPTAEQINDPVQLDEVIRATVLSAFHPTGSCRMGAFDNIQQGVVDSNLCVHGVKGLRVADASIMPQAPTGNTSAASLMIGAMAAKLIAAGTSCSGL